MSRKATSEYIGARRRAYAAADREKRIRILDDVCETTGYERKYANRLLTGNRKFRERKGRGRTYKDDVADVLGKVWREAGCPCLPYFKAEVERWVDEYSAQVAHIRPDMRRRRHRFLAVPASTATAAERRYANLPPWKHSFSAT